LKLSEDRLAVKAKKSNVLLLSFPKITFRLFPTTRTFNTWRIWRHNIERLRQMMRSVDGSRPDVCGCDAVENAATET
jgi:hypothetical protein